VNGMPKTRIEMISAILWLTLSCILIGLQHMLPYMVLMFLLLFMAMLMLELVFWCEYFSEIKPYRLSIFISIVHNAFGMLWLTLSLAIAERFKIWNYFSVVLIIILQEILKDLLIKKVSSIEKVYNKLPKIF
jgi:hypothetical protein